MSIYLGNAFAGSMVIGRAEIIKDDIDEETAAIIAKNAKSVIGHQQTADILTKRFGYPVAFNRENLRLETGDILVTASANKRLPEGVTELPEGYELVFQRWEIKSN